MKRFLGYLLSFALLFSLVGSLTVFAAKNEANDAMTASLPTASFSVDARSAVLMEANTGKVLFCQNENAAYSPASVTKIMTLLLTMEALDSGKIALYDTVSISANAASMGGSQVFLEEGETMSVEELLKCAVIASANDAAVALAEAISGSEDVFVTRMNERAAELGMTSTHFENATGLDDDTDNHVTSAMDIAIMSRELLKHRTILQYSSLWQDSIRDGAFTLTNTNRLVRFYKGCNGLKTGSTDKALYCVSVTAKRDNTEFIAVIMGAPTRDVRNAAARTLLDYGFSTFGLWEDNELTLEQAPVKGGTVDRVTLYAEPFSCVLEKSDLKNVAKQYEIPEYLAAPLHNGDGIGKITYSVDGEVIGETKIYVKEDIPKITFFTLWLRMLHHIAGI